MWGIDSRGNGTYLISLKEDYKPDISANGKCLKFIPDIADIFKKQRKKDAKKSTYIEPK